MTVDGADEVDPQLNLIKGDGRALIREKVIAAASRQLIILVGDEKLVPQLGTRGKLPVEVLPFAVPVCERRLRELGLVPTLDRRGGEPLVTDNGNYILDCQVDPIADPQALENQIRSIPGVVGTGLFLDMADIVLVGRRSDFELVAEKHRAPDLARPHEGRADVVEVQKVSIASLASRPPLAGAASV
jgi:ribose 5-phosphate isomerase A